MLKKPFKSQQKKIDKDYSKLIFKLYYETAFKAAYSHCGDQYIAEEAAQKAVFIAIQKTAKDTDIDLEEAWERFNQKYPCKKTKTAF